MYPKTEKARRDWEKLIFYACGFRSSKTFPSEKSELVQPSLHCSAIIFELIGPIQTQKKHPFAYSMISEWML
ncbi:hypothetical protein B0533_14025 [Sedimentibacter sp. SX930]|jgi:hypothetical protein|nr:hypothetical protein B0533_14025 [Sedimentibacter sp. SX930]